MTLNKNQWMVIWIISAIFFLNLCLALVPVARSWLWPLNIAFLLLGSGLFYALRNEDMGE